MSRALSSLSLMLGLLASAPAVAQTFALGGVLDDGDARADGTFTVDLALIDNDVTLWTETQTGVIVVDGAFAIDVGAIEPINIDVPASTQLVIAVDGDEFTTLPLHRVLLASRVARAASATTTTTARRVGGLLPEEVATRAELAAGAVPVPFAALTGLPAGLADGDTGQDIALGANSGLTLTNRTLSLGSVPGTKLATGAVTRAALAAGSVPATRIAAGAIGAEHVIDGSLGGGDLAADVTAREVATTTIFQVTAELCAQPPGALMARGSCTTTATATCAIGQLRRCDVNACAPLATAIETCSNTPIGELVLP